MSISVARHCTTIDSSSTSRRLRMTIGAILAAAPLVSAPVRDGQSLTLDVRKRDQSNRAIGTVFARRF